MLDFKKYKLPADVVDVLSKCPAYVVAKNAADLIALSCRDAVNGWHEVAYDVPGKGRVIEARVCRVRNGVSANYTEPYMRRRDPDCMVIADDLPTDKPRFKDRYGEDFARLRQETFDWLRTQELAVYFFSAGTGDSSINTMVVAPANCGFFAFGLMLLQGILDPEELPNNYSPDAVIYVAPPFRHTFFNGKQVVVHNRTASLYEMFSYNLYPGPSAKKGVYGMLIDLGVKEHWVATHCATVQVVTPYDNKVTIMHEGASGGGKSEMLEQIHRERDGRVLLGRNVLTGEERHFILPRACLLRPVTDDMALCPPSLQKGNGKITLVDAERAWFVRVNHITRYGTDPHLEELTIHPPEPVLFLNIDAVPGSTALIWEHTEDTPGVRCPNPRVILPRRIVPGVVNGPVTVDIRSFGIRTPPCTKENPTYGIIGLFHVLPPALAWLWRLVAPRGHENPSIVQTEGMTSEGVGSYWPFVTGRRVDQANLLLQQIIETPRTGYILCPNQHIGAWRVGFCPQWLAREYLARRGGAQFANTQVVPARCSLLGYALNPIMIEGQPIGDWLLQVDKQPDVGKDAYDRGAAILAKFFHDHLVSFLEPDLSATGKRIIDCCLSGGTIEDYVAVLGGRSIFTED